MNLHSTIMKTQVSTPKTGAKNERSSGPATKNDTPEQRPKRPDVDTPNQRTPAEIEKRMQRSPKQENL